MVHVIRARHALDSFDRAILDILQRDNTTPQRAIGEAVNLSAPAVQRRIRRMEEEGVIQANVAVVDPHKVGRPLTIIVLGGTGERTHRPDRCDQEKLRGSPSNPAMLLRHR